jgi:hypothetical protein
LVASPQITKVIFDEIFKNKLNSAELGSWKSLQSPVRGFVGAGGSRNITPK